MQGLEHLSDPCKQILLCVLHYLGEILYLLIEEPVGSELGVLDDCISLPIGKVLGVLALEHVDDLRGVGSEFWDLVVRRGL